jgi:AI-2 transport protein TqsA
MAIGTRRPVGPKGDALQSSPAAACPAEITASTLRPPLPPPTPRRRRPAPARPPVHRRADKSGRAARDPAPSGADRAVGHDGDAGGRSAGGAPSPAALGFINAAALAAIVAALQWAQSFVVPVLLAVLLSALAAPVVTRLVGRGVPRTAAVALALVCLLVSVGAIGALFSLSARELRELLPVYAERVPALLGGAASALNRQGFSTTPEQLSAMLGGAGALALVRSTLFTTADLVSQGVLVLLLVFFALCEVVDLGGKLRRLMPDADAGFRRVEHAVQQVRAYLLLKAATSAIAALGVAAVLVALRVDFVLPLALFMFLAHFVPNVGPIVATVPAVAVALLGRGLGPAALVTVGYVALLFSIGNVLEPRLFGRRLGLSPFAVIAAMFFWGWLWGPLGALLAVPITMVIRVACERVGRLRWIAILLDPVGPTSEPHSRRPGELTAPACASAHARASHSG